MTKQEFLCALQKRLSGLPMGELEERLGFYGEMIDDRMEEGLDEEQAVKEVGSVDDIASQIITDVPLSKIAKEKIKPKRRFEVWEIVLLVLSAPIWLSLAFSVLSTVFSLYVLLWTVVISFWSVFVSLLASAMGMMVAGILFVAVGKGLAGMAMIGAALLCAGLSVFWFFGCKGATKGVIWLTKMAALGIKKCFMRRENVS